MPENHKAIFFVVYFYGKSFFFLYICQIIKIWYMKIIAIGWNYPRHNAELGQSVDRPAEPTIFMKPETALLRSGEAFYLPDFSQDLQYEAEVVFRISKMGKNISRQFASRYYDAVTLGVDFTARDLQHKFQKNGGPWELCKSFDGSAPVGPFVPLNQIENLSNVHFRLDLNGECVQNGCTADQFFHIDDIIAYVSRFITLKSGDLVFTGTPQGVGAVKVGDRLTGYLEDKKMFDIPIC